MNGRGFSKSVRNRFKKLFAVVVFFLSAISSQIYTYPHIPLKGIFEVLKVDDIGFAHALLHSNWIENMYQYGEGKPHRKVSIKKGKATSWKAEYKTDAVANLIRKLWFRKSENHQLLPTKFGILSSIPNDQLGIVFGKLINYVYKGCRYQEQGTAFIDELFAYDTKATHCSSELAILLQDLESKKMQLKNKRFAGLQEATKTFREKLKRLEKKSIKSIEQAEREAFSGISQEVLAVRDEYKKIARAMKECQNKIKAKIDRRHKKRKKALFDPIRNAMQLCYSGEKYIARTTESILWAFFFHKLDSLISLQEKITAINNCLSEIDKDFKNESFYGKTGKIELTELYDKKDFDLFGQYFREQGANSNTQEITSQLLLDYCHVGNDSCDQTERIFKHYDIGLHYFIQLAAGAFPPSISQGDYGYEYEPGNISQTRPDCYEAALLDLFSILWYNPKTKAYDDSLFAPHIVEKGEGFRKLREALKYLYLADCKGIQADEYTCTSEIRGAQDKIQKITFTSLAKLKSLGKISPAEVKALDISQVPVSYITRSEIKQEFMNIISEIPGVLYCSKVKEVKERGKIFEVKSDPRNFVKIFNYFYGTSAKNIKELSNEIIGLSIANREVAFECEGQSGLDLLYNIKISVNDQENGTYFDMIVHISACHAYLSVKRRGESFTKIFKKSFVLDLIAKLNTMKHSTVFMLRSSKKILKNAKANWGMPILNLIYYSLAMKTPEVKLAIIKDIVERCSGYYDYKEIIRNLIEKFPADDGYLKGELNKTILLSGLYKKDSFLKKYIERDSHEKLLFDVITFANEDQERQVLEVYKDLVTEVLDINAVPVIDSAIMHGYKKIVELIKGRKEFSVGKNLTLFCNHTLCNVIRMGFSGIVLEIIDHEKFDMFDMGSVPSFALKMFHLRHDDRYKGIACKILEDPKFDDWDEALRVADKQGWSDVVFDLIMHEKFAGQNYWFASLFKIGLKNLVLLKQEKNSDIVLNRYKEVVLTVMNHNMLKSQKRQINKFLKIAQKAGKKYAKKHPECEQGIKKFINVIREKQK